MLCTLLISCLALTPIPSLSAKELTDTITSQFFKASPTTEEQQLLDLVNKERLKNGMAALKTDPKLLQMARDYGREMEKNRFFGHVSPVSGDLFKRFSKSDVRKDWQIAGENLAISTTVEGAHTGLMSSPKHKENLLDPRYTDVGIGIVKGPTGKMVVQEFASYPPEMQPAAVLQTANELLVLIAGWFIGTM
jgi:uncharacterized protein YkwD